MPRQIGFAAGKIAGGGTGFDGTTFPQEVNLGMSNAMGRAIRTRVFWLRFALIVAGWILVTMSPLVFQAKHAKHVAFGFPLDFATKWIGEWSFDPGLFFVDLFFVLVVSFFLALLVSNRVNRKI